MIAGATCALFIVVATTAPGSPTVLPHSFRSGVLASSGTLGGQGDDSRIVFRSERDGNSEIYQLAVDSTLIWRITEQEFDDQAPVWSRHGTGLAFASNANGEFEVHLAEPGIGESFTTGQKGRPVPWLN